MRPSSGLAQAGATSRSSVSTLNSPTRTLASAWICRLCASSEAGRQLKVKLRAPMATLATRSTVAVPE